MLRRFNERAARLNERQFLAALRSGKGSYRMHGKAGSPIEVTGDFATDEEVEAYVLTLRLFVQDNDSISIRRLADAYERSPRLAMLVPRVQAIRDKLNAYLDAKSPIIWERSQLVRRTIMDVFIYGGLAHTHVTKTELYDRWMASFMAVPLKSEFHEIAAVLTRAVFALRQVNLEALELPGPDA